MSGRLEPGRPRANGCPLPERASFPPAAATPSHSTNYRREATGVVGVAASSTRTRTRFYHAPPQPHPG